MSLAHRRVEPRDISRLYSRITEPRRMEALLKLRRRRDLVAAMRRIATEEQLGGVQQAALDQLAEVVRLLQRDRLARDAARMAEENRRRLQAEAAAERERKRLAEEARAAAARLEAEQQAVRMSLEANAAHIESERARGFSTPTVGLAFAEALRANGSRS